MNRARKPMSMLLAYALLWPITFGDKFARMHDRTADAACSSPWVFYRDLGQSLFGAQGETDEGGIRSDEGTQTAELVPVLKRRSCDTAAPADTAPARVSAELAARPPTPHLPIPPPSPVVPYHLDSKE